jgi:hypothetical protein
VATQQKEMIAAVVDPAPPPDQTFIGYAGGDVALDRTLPVKAGEFVLLSRFRRLKFSANRIVKEFGWYRVIASDTIGSQQILTLHGKDWNFANPLGNERTWVTYTPGILSIHEETVRLEGIPN